MKYIVLYSGGIDSTAALLILDRMGLEYEIAHFIVSPSATKRAIVTLHRLGIYNRHIHLWDHRAFLQVASRQRPSLTCLMCKRAMIENAKRLGIPVTGDSLGQVASQTLHNLKVIGDAARPLLGSDKEDVDLFLMRVLKERRKLELVRKGSVQRCPFKPVRPTVRAAKEEERAVRDLVKKYSSLIKYLGMKRVSDLTVMG